MRHHLQFLFSAFVLVLCFSFSQVASAQEITGSIIGTVKDANGAGVPNTTVTITDSEKKIVIRTTQTNVDGIYSEPHLPVGRYEVLSEGSGIKQ